MSLYSTDFSEYSTGSAPSDWTDQWATSWSTNVESSTARMDSSYGAQVLEIDPTATARKILTWDDIDVDANRDDVEVLVRYQVSTYNASYYSVRAHCRGSGAAASENIYSLHLNGGFLYLHKYVAGVSSNLDSVRLSLIADPFQPTRSDEMGVWLRLRANGTLIQGKFWTDQQVEPAGWMVEATDSDVSGVGWAGVGNFSDMSTYKGYVDYFAVGTNGDSPAVPIATTGNAELGAEHIEVAYTEAATEVQLGAMHTEVAFTEAATEVQLGAMHIEVAHGTEPVLPEPPVQSMETLMMESFETYGSFGTMLEESFRWAGYTGIFVPGLNPTGGRDGKQCLKLNNSSTNFSLYSELRKAVRTIVIGFAVRWDTLPDTATDGPLLISAGLRVVGATQLSLALNTSGKLELYRGTVGSGTLLGTGTKVFQAATWYYIECRAYIDNTAGSYEVRVDEVTDLSDTSVDTQAHATDNTARSFSVVTGEAPASGTNKVRFDDVYVRGHPTDDVADGFLGNIIIEAMMPNANGTYRQWTLSTGTDEYALIDEQPASDTDYLYSGTAGARVILGMEDLTGTDAIVSVMAYHHTSGKVGGMRELKPFCRNSGNQVDDGTQLCREFAYLWGVHFPYDPATNIAWTVSGFNAAEFGIEVV